MIEHEGIIEKINDNQVTVRILQQSACSACHAKGVCMAADSKEKLVEVVDFSGRFRENERVIIEGKESMGYKAVFWAFVLPLVILILTLILTLSLWNFSETEAAISAMTALIPYYLILYFLRKKMANSFQFNIKKMNSE
ncbi:Positive regulator of sigma E activity [Proteiniphilum saccharofermentans]|jgi:sigma-E factor negative regulatory protein RseC|uniref:Positive regulator of sigma E activity n=1 Tax=Proteiniphilum saccharofermentans TaxID=1642647 RepID=A0A1R3T0W3_9BACT|nr:MULTISPECIES: SoxR reducing system RseC family protein [Proteiniphilum]MDY9918710.1 SoxR reducing system RseC family protein [Proteiniphilum sp.]SCD19712.1 Positive regulator of sigma E activity [Proteiniphilum saccharofermentans]SDZ86055.1 positive regulator of sigma(E), RseC/MucC [Porphyromonadaceae bacterium KH3R12]SFS96025.1 positive regulator of sigma(E), RseC/MucC [Porphyromonadaceae bacterium NLAE-zl-C104]